MLLVSVVVIQSAVLEAVQLQSSFALTSIVPDPPVASTNIRVAETASTQESDKRGNDGCVSFMSSVLLIFVRALPSSDIAKSSPAAEKKIVEPSEDQLGAGSST